MVQIGEMFGIAAKTQDDGGIVDSVLCAKVPELVGLALAQLAELRLALEACVTKLVEYATLDALAQMEGGGTESDPELFIKTTLDQARRSLARTPEQAGRRVQALERVAQEAQYLLANWMHTGTTVRLADALAALREGKE